MNRHRRHLIAAARSTIPPVTDDAQIIGALKAELADWRVTKMLTPGGKARVEDIKRVLKSRFGVTA